jgi:hypothetical protein
MKVKLNNQTKKAERNNFNATQQSVHLTLGILRQSQAVSHALAFFWLDGFAVPHPSAGNANRWAVASDNLNVNK